MSFPYFNLCNEWTALPTTILEGNRYACGYVSLGDDLFFCGGKCSSFEFFDSLLSYNCTRQQWTSHLLPPCNLLPCWSAAAAIDDHRFVVVGGYPSESAAWTLMYDTANKSWSRLPDLNMGRRKHACVAVDSKVYAIGGWNPHSLREEATVEVLDLSSMSTTSPCPEWIVLPEELTTRRTSCAATVDCNGNIVVTGGYNEDDGLLDTMEIFNTERQVWDSTVPLPPMSTPRLNHGIVAINDGQLIVVMGGETNKGITPSVEGLCFDNNSDGNPPRWITLPPMNTARSSFAVLVTKSTAAATATQRDIVVVAGGRDDNKNPLDTMELLQPTQDDIEYWTVLNPPPLIDLLLPVVRNGNPTRLISAEEWLRDTETRRREYKAQVAETTKQIANEKAALEAKARTLQGKLDALQRTLSDYSDLVDSKVQHVTETLESMAMHGTEVVVYEDGTSTISTITCPSLDS